MAVMRRFRLRRAHQHACSCSCSNSPLHFDVSTCEGRMAAVAAPAQGRDRHIGAPASDLEHDAPCICISAQAGQRLPAHVRRFEAVSPGRSRGRARLWSAATSRGRPFRWHRIRMSAMCCMGPCLDASLVGSVPCRFLPSARAYSHVDTSSGPSREAFADREHTGEMTVPADRHRAADRPSWPGRGSKIAEIGSSRSRHRWRYRRGATLEAVCRGLSRLIIRSANGSIGAAMEVPCAEGAPAGGKWAGSKSH